MDQRSSGVPSATQQDLAYLDPSYVAEALEEVFADWESDSVRSDFHDPYPDETYARARADIALRFIEGLAQVDPFGDDVLEWEVLERAVQVARLIVAAKRREVTY